MNYSLPCCKMDMIRYFSPFHFSGVQSLILAEPRFVISKGFSVLSVIKKLSRIIAPVTYLHCFFTVF